ncbi:hypothetical protein ACO7_320003 [Thiomonas arsenitoxydans]|nr:hypothetical protein ACO7_320003 [Thiomonas arsenitoxydans]CQR32777.1 hypothetical protein ACO3_340003 [Thiomonas arsenitoxydans]
MLAMLFAVGPIPRLQVRNHKPHHPNGPSGHHQQAERHSRQGAHDSEPPFSLVGACSCRRVGFRLFRLSYRM